MAKSANETSAIIVLAKNDTDIILWGADNTIRTISMYTNPNASLLFGPHHGSPGINKGKDIPAIVASIAPSQCVLSFGTKNAYDHPHRGYIQALVNNKVHLICIQKSRRCAAVNDSTILNGDALYALYQPENGIPCHGHVRMVLDNLSLKDEYEEEYLINKNKVSNRLCKA